MAYSEDHIALAAEYALGTLDADERAQVETMMAADDEFTAIVHAWEYRLGVLNQMVGPIEPRPVVWENIKTAIGHSTEQRAPLVLPEAPPASPAPEPPAEVATAVETPAVVEPPARQPAADNSNIVLLSDARARRWRNVASIATAVAAALIAVLGMQVYQPDRLPEALRPTPRIQTVEVKVPAPPQMASGQYVALLQRDAGSPAFILTVDAATKNFTVRRVGSGAEPGKSFELWLISDKLPQPRSLGVIGGSDFTARPVLAGYDTGTINAATFAVTVEQAGGSPTGQPTSAPIYTGKLIETVPAR
ncbi:anti-sigma factor domain-containing protein [Bradyrhizobium sp. BWA-3-5]|uniref:anti-sigma factor n=1 Tax=Bradyrhizobium sp. BWA-3-5 TaxID=3080013 RepID=UPI00293EC06C|nr:anti-sigma factor [Bradyrhizobium sp. BWA-3-5]WOH65337.1 anti-sigma factor [Bradyrhizobium sp. BWA-3-5]